MNISNKKMSVGEYATRLQLPDTGVVFNDEEKMYYLILGLPRAEDNKAPICGAVIGAFAAEEFDGLNEKDALKRLNEIVDQIWYMFSEMNVQKEGTEVGVRH